MAVNVVEDDNLGRTVHDVIIKWKHFLCHWPFVRETTGDGGFPSQRPVAWSFDVVFDLRLNKWLSKQTRSRWFEMPSHSLWCHCNENPLEKTEAFTFSIISYVIFSILVLKSSVQCLFWTVMKNLLIIVFYRSVYFKSYHCFMNVLQMYSVIQSIHNWLKEEILFNFITFLLSWTLCSHILLGFWIKKTYE